jgi:hypothetical protein
MKAITLHQPWASFCFGESKPFETRSWKTPYRGKLLIHAAKVPIYNEGARVLRNLLELAARKAAMQSGYPASESEIQDLVAEMRESSPPHPLGAIIGMVYLVDCVPAEAAAQSLDIFQLQTGDYTPGRWAWKLEHAVRFETPIPARGKQGLWDYDEPLPVEYFDASFRAPSPSCKSC